LLEGVPKRVHGDEAAEIIGHLAALPERYDITVEFDGEVGTVVL
jgi:hypothetical protein